MDSKRYVVEYNEDADGRVDSAYFATEEEAVAFARSVGVDHIYGPAW